MYYKTGKQNEEEKKKGKQTTLVIKRDNRSKKIDLFLKANADFDL